jgi:AcrR family transcriptional regulator
MSDRPGLTIDRIVAVATEIADRDGYAGLTLGKVAGALQVRTPSLYNHIAGLEDLRRLLRLRALRGLGDDLQRSAVGRTSGEALRALAGAYRRFALRHPGLYAATVPSYEGADDEVQQAGDDVVRTVLAALSGYHLGEEEAIHAARALRSAVHGFVSLELAGGFGLPVDLDRSFERLIDLLAAGFDVRAGTSQPG